MEKLCGVGIEGSIVRHPFHAICPYFAMFPESFVEDAVLALSKQGDLVLDPFVGRGTTVFQSLLMGRMAAGLDINPVAYCIASSKADPPSLLEVLSRVELLREEFNDSIVFIPEDLPVFFDFCFSYQTLRQIVFLRKTLNWKGSRVDRFIAALLLGVLHGESNRSARYLSNQMPRTISTKPAYSIRWWKSNSSSPPRRDCFQILRDEARFRYAKGVAPERGTVVMGDARKASEALGEYNRKVSLVVTSPPYLNVTDYAEDQWLRLWFLGGQPFPMRRAYSDDRHRNENEYWRFLSEVWQGCQDLLGDRAVIVVRIGGKLGQEALAWGLQDSLALGLSDFFVGSGQSLKSTGVLLRETGRFRGRTAGVEHDFAFEVKRVRF